MEAISILCHLPSCFLNDGTNTSGCTNIRTASNVSVNSFIDKAFFFLFFFPPQKVWRSTIIDTAYNSKYNGFLNTYRIFYNAKISSLTADRIGYRWFSYYIFVLFREQKLFLIIIIFFFCKLPPPPLLSIYHFCEPDYERCR